VALAFSTIVLQDGPVRENGVNGDQIDEVLRFVVETLRKFNQPPYESDYTTRAIALCDEALDELAARTNERVARGVEGTSQA
jgi:hypothetical protein